MLRPEGTADGFRLRSVLIRRAGMCAHIESAGSGHPTPAAGTFVLLRTPDDSYQTGRRSQPRSEPDASFRAREVPGRTHAFNGHGAPTAAEHRHWSWDAGITNAVVEPPGVGSEPEVSRLTR
jgi:hypothetical protein